MFLSVACVFEYERVEADGFDEVRRLKTRYMKRIEVFRMAFQHYGRRVVEFVAYLDEIFRKFFGVVFFEPLVHHVFDYFVFYKRFRPDFQHKYSITRYPEKNNENSKYIANKTCAVCD